MVNLEHQVQKLNWTGFKREQADVNKVSKYIRKFHCKEQKKNEMVAERREIRTIFLSDWRNITMLGCCQKWSRRERNTVMMIKKVRRIDGAIFFRIRDGMGFKAYQAIMESVAIVWNTDNASLVTGVRSMV